MSSSLKPPQISHLYPNPNPTRHNLTQTPRATRIQCGSGPRSNRGPLVKGRILSTQAILAIQSLKRAHKSNPSNPSIAPNVALSRLLKPDLVAALRELLRQDECTLALQVFSVIQSEPWYNPDFALYADIVLALSRNGLLSEIDVLIGEMEMECGVVKLDDKKGLGRLVRAVISADRKDAVLGVYRVMKRSGWGVEGSGVELDEYLAKVLSRGFKRFKEVELAQEVDLDLENYLNACLGAKGYKVWSWEVMPRVHGKDAKEFSGREAATSLQGGT